MSILDPTVSIALFLSFSSCREGINRWFVNARNKFTCFYMPVRTYIWYLSDLTAGDNPNSYTYICPSSGSHLSVLFTAPVRRQPSLSQVWVKMRRGVGISQSFTSSNLLSSSAHPQFPNSLTGWQLRLYDNCPSRVWPQPSHLTHPPSGGSNGQVPTPFPSLQLRGAITPPAVLTLSLFSAVIHLAELCLRVTFT